MLFSDPELSWAECWYERIMNVHKRENSYRKRAVSKDKTIVIPVKKRIIKDEKDNSWLLCTDRNRKRKRVYQGLDEKGLRKWNQEIERNYEKRR